MLFVGQSHMQPALCNGTYNTKDCTAQAQWFIVVQYRNGKYDLTGKPSIF